MRDKSLEVFLMLLLGLGGVMILILACTQPMPLNERIVTTFVGLAGLVWVLTRALSFISMLPKTGLPKHPPEVDVQKKGST